MTPAPDWQRGGDLRYLAIGRDQEVFVDGHCVYYGPIKFDSSSRKLGFCFQNIGVDATISHVVWKRIMPAGATTAP
jgi:hypothetical protein